MHNMTCTSFLNDRELGWIGFGRTAEVFEWKNDTFCTKISNLRELAKLTLPHSHKYVAWPAWGAQTTKSCLEMNLDLLRAHLSGKMAFLYQTLGFWSGQSKNTAVKSFFAIETCWDSWKWAWRLRNGFEWLEPVSVENCRLVSSAGHLLLCAGERCWVWSPALGSRSFVLDTCFKN